MIKIIIASIVLFFLIFIILQTRSRSITRNNTCNKDIMYLDDLYYDLPELNVITDNKDLSYINKEPHKYQPILQVNSNQQASRWAGSIESRHSK